MGNQKIIGLVLFAVGLILLYFGWQSSESVGDRISETFTGRFTDETMLFLIGGVVGVVAGGVMAFRK
jgi:hypothetical protein